VPAPDLSAAFESAERNDYRPSQAPRSAAHAHDAHDAHDAHGANDAHDARGFDQSSASQPQMAAPGPQPSAASRPAGQRVEHDDQLLMHFFSSSPPPVSDASDDHYHVPMSVGSQRAMWASMAIFAVSIVSIGGYTAYHQLVMPAPVELGGALSAELVPAAEAIHPVPSSVSEPPPPVLAQAPVASQPATPPIIAPIEPPSSAAPIVPAPVEAPPAAAQPLAITSAPHSMPVAPAITAPATPPPTAAPMQAPKAVEAEQPTADVAPATQAASAPTTTLPSYEELIGVGQAFARKGRNSQALEAYQRALDAQPSAAAALAGIAYVHLNSGDPGLAKLFATRAVESDPRSSQGWIVLGAALELLGDRAAARAAYRKCATEAVGAYALECRQLAH
jgi:hypothetical protein